MSIFTGIPTATLQTWLTEAQTAMQALAVGTKTVQVRMGDKQLAFTPADLSKLKSYIGQLPTAIAINTGQTVGGPYSVATWTR